MVFIDFSHSDLQREVEGGWLGVSTHPNTCVSSYRVLSWLNVLYREVVSLISA